jgi:hypothetical protein
MNHCSDDDLLLEYYGEPPSAAAHLSVCGECTARFRELRASLDALALDAPERGEHYGLEVWQAIRHRLPVRDPRWYQLLDLRWAYAAAAAVVLLATGFAAGRLWPDSAGPASAAPAAAVAAVAADDEEARRRVVLTAVSEHFDRSDRVLAEVMNVPGPRDLSAEQAWAGDLVAASRLYRQNVIAIDEPAIAAVLEEVERVLLDIVHQPSRATAADLDDIRRRIDSAALLFKVRVMTSELQRQLQQPSTRSTSTSTIG